MSLTNNVQLKGNLTRDPELRYLNTGKALTTFGIAVTTKYGEGKEETLFVDVSVFGKRAEVVAEYFQKGSPMLLEGRLQLNQWTDKEGNKRSMHKILLNDFEFIGQTGKGGKKEEAPKEKPEEIPF